MKCKSCDNLLSDGAKFCNRCGKPLQEQKKEVVDIKYLSVPLKRFVLLSILTLGFYELYWFARNWILIQRAEKTKIKPVWRGIFSIFYCHSLFEKVLQSAKKQGYTESYSPTTLATFYIILSLFSNGLSRVESADFGFNLFWLLLVSSTVVPLSYIQKAINFNNSRVEENYEENRKFSRGEIITVILGAIWFGLVVFGVFSVLIPE